MRCSTTSSQKGKLGGVWRGYSLRSIWPRSSTLRRKEQSGRSTSRSPGGKVKPGAVHYRKVKPGMLRYRKVKPYAKVSNTTKSNSLFKLTF